MNKLSVVGKGLPRPDALDKTTGKTRYVSDLSLPGMAYAGVFYSPHAHAMIKWLDIDKARELPGVLAILTARDIKGKNIIPMIKEDWVFLAEKEVRYPGEPMALIVAETEAVIEEAKKAIQAAYEEIPAVFDPEEALKPDAPKVHPNGNLVSHYTILSGDIEKGFAEADIIVEGTYETDYQEHAYMETQGFLANPGPEGSIELYGSMQCPFYVLNAVSSILGIPQNKIQVIQTPTGGAFGGKEDIPSLFGGLAALAAYHTRRPVKLILGRRDDIIMSSKRHPSRTYYRTGAKKDGTLTACEIKIYLDPGAYATLTPAVLWRCTVHCYGPYRIPHVKVNSYAGATNKVPCGAFRGFGTPQVIFAMERQMDKIAEALGMDPLILREKNCWRTGDQTATGQNLPWSVGMSETIARAKIMSRWNDKRSPANRESRENIPTEQIPGSRIRGMGCATFPYGVGLGAAGRRIDRAEAFVQVKPDGSVLFAVGTTDMGQGMQTVLSQIVAEAFGGLDLEKIRMLPVDTTRVEDSGPTVASRATYTSGNALLTACGKISNSMKKVAADIISCPLPQVRMNQGAFFAEETNNQDPEKGEQASPVSFADVARECYQRHVPLSEHGFFASPPTSWNQETGQGKAYVCYSYATQIAEVEVDRETGEIRVLHVWAVHDVGKSINPQQTEAQIEGGVLQGMGFALMEFLETDENGRIQNPSFSTYIIPTSEDAPEIHPGIVESPYPEGPYGGKGFGETPLMGMGACIANAVANATGIDIQSLPILPEEILSSLSLKFEV